MRTAVANDKNAEVVGYHSRKRRTRSMSYFDDSDFTPINRSNSNDNVNRDRNNNNNNKSSSESKRRTSSDIGAEGGLNGDSADNDGEDCDASAAVSSANDDNDGNDDDDVDISVHEEKNINNSNNNDNINCSNGDVNNDDDINGENDDDNDDDMPTIEDYVTMTKTEHAVPRASLISSPSLSACSSSRSDRATSQREAEEDLALRAPPHVLTMYHRGVSFVMMMMMMMMMMIDR